MEQGLDPSRIVREVDEGSSRLERAADTFYATVKRFEEAENAYEMAMAKERVRAYEMAEGKLAADLRNDYALRRIDQQVRLEYAAAKAEKEAQTVLFRALQSAVSARQSLLKYLTGGG